MLFFSILLSLPTWNGKPKLSKRIKTYHIFFPSRQYPFKNLLLQSLIASILSVLLEVLTPIWFKLWYYAWGSQFTNSCSPKLYSPKNHPLLLSHTLSFKQQQQIGFWTISKIANTCIHFLNYSCFELSSFRGKLASW